MKSVRLLIAARLSQLHDGQTGLESQTDEVQAWAVEQGHEIVHVAADTKTGTSAMWARPNLKPWVTEPEKIIQYDAIVAYKSDRLSRAKWSDEIKIRLWAEENDKQLFIINPYLHWPPDNYAEQLSWEIFAAQAHEEWKNTSERYRRMHNYLRTADRPDGGKGYFVGRPPFGYKIRCAADCGEDKCGHHKILVPHEKHSAYVLEMVERYLAGDSLASICEWLDGEGIKPSGSRVSKHGIWQQKAIRDVLSNPAIIGQRRNGAGKILQCEPILTDIGKWNRLQAALETRRGKPARGKVRDEPALLSGVLFCARCERVMHYLRTTNTRKDGSKQYNYFYRCNGTTFDRSDCRNMLPLDLADSYADLFMTEGIGRLPVIMRAVIPGSSHEDEVEMVKADMAALDPEADDYIDRVLEMKAELTRLRSLPSSPAQVAEVETGRTMAQHWESLKSVAERRKWLMAGRVTFHAYMPPKRFQAPENAPEPTLVTPDGRPVTFTVEFLTGAEWSVSMPAEALGEMLAEAVHPES